MPDDDSTQMDQAGTSTRLDRLEAKLDQLLSSTHAKAEDHTGKRLDRPSTIEEQVRAELERAEQERSAKAAADAAAAEQETLAQRLARLEEKPPEQPAPRRTRVMWGAGK
jgi:hypothetical protein